jgi:hypothetical protein
MDSTTLSQATTIARTPTIIEILVAIYLQNATSRLQSMIEGFAWSLEDTYVRHVRVLYLPFSS